MSKLCPGSGVTHPASCASTLCYCGKVFRRRFRSLKPWQVPKHEHVFSLTDPATVDAERLLHVWILQRELEHGRRSEQLEQVAGAVIDASDAREMGFDLV